MSIFGNNIKKIRKTKNLSQMAFAELFDLKRPTLGAYEEGRSLPKLETVIKIAHHFGISIDKLLTEEVTVNQLSKFDDFLLMGESLPQKKDKILFLPSDKVISYCKTPDKKMFKSGLSKIEFPFIRISNGMAFQLHEDLGVYKAGDILIAMYTAKPKFEHPTIGISTEQLVFLTEQPEDLNTYKEYWVLESVFKPSVSEVHTSNLSLEERVLKLEQEMKHIKASKL